METMLKLVLKTVAVATVVKVTFDLLDKAQKEDLLGKAKKKVAEAQAWADARRGGFQDPS